MQGADYLPMIRLHDVLTYKATCEARGAQHHHVVLLHVVRKCPDALHNAAHTIHSSIHRLSRLVRIAADTTCCCFSHEARAWLDLDVLDPG